MHSPRKGILNRFEFTNGAFFLGSGCFFQGSGASEQLNEVKVNVHTHDCRNSEPQQAQPPCVGTSEAFSSFLQIRVSCTNDPPGEEVQVYPYDKEQNFE